MFIVIGRAYFHALQPVETINTSFAQLTHGTLKLC